MKLRGLVNLITGGCSGLGLSTAKHLISQGGKVVLLDINEKAGDECVKQLGPTNAGFIPCNVAEEQSSKRAFEEANKVFGDIRVYVNCAGIAMGDSIIGENGPHDPAIFRKVLDVNLFGTFLSTTLAAYHLKKVPLEGKERGVIINLSSIASKYASVQFAGYGASKGALEGMLQPVARELGKHKIRLMNIAPGLMITPMNDGISQEDRELIASFTLKGDLGEAEHIALAVEAIIRNGYLNGTTIKVDDGIIPPIF